RRLRSRGRQRSRLRRAAGNRARARNRRSHRRPRKRHGAGPSRRQTHQPGHGHKLRNHAQEAELKIMDTNTQRASKLDTTSLSDALDRLGIAGQCLGIKPLDHRFRMTGRAFTLLYGPSAKPSGTVGDYIDDLTPDTVVVLDNGGRENATVWGDILTTVAHTK